jgi:hypothetical protein
MAASSMDMPDLSPLTPGRAYWLLTLLGLSAGGLIAFGGICAVGRVLLPTAVWGYGEAVAFVAVTGTTTFIVSRLSTLPAMTRWRRAAGCALSLVLQYAIALALLIVFAVTAIYVECHTGGGCAM